MKGTKKVILAIVAFVVIVFVIQLIYMPIGQSIYDWKVLLVEPNEVVNEISDFRTIKLPYIETIANPGLYEFSAIVFPDDMNSNVLNIRRLNGYAFEVSLNGQMIYKKGDFNIPTANLWNHSYLIDIPDGLLHQKNIFVIKVYGLHDIGFIMEPTIGNRTDFNFMVELQNMLGDGLSYMIVGASTILGALLILLGFNRGKSFNSYYIQFGTAFILFSIYNQDYIYRDYTGSLEFYLFFRKVLIFSIMLAMGLLVAGCANYLYEYKVDRKISIGYVLLMLPIFLPNSFMLLQVVTSAYNQLNVLIIGIIIVVVSKNPQRQLRFSVTFLLLVIIHAIIVFTYRLPYITHLSFGICVFLVGITYSVVSEFGKLHTENIQLDIKTTVDVLTGAYNREFIERINAKEKDAFIFIDIDYFKIYNDMLGHHMGDILLIELVNKIKHIIRPEDAVIRYGGDEFVIYLQQTDLLVAEQKVKLIMEYIVKNYEFVDISYGVSLFVGSIQETLRISDKLMYQMKEERKSKLRA